MPKISIIIPCYNQGKYIEEAIESVKRQTFRYWEIIIVNDGSTDKLTNKLLPKLVDRKIRLIKTKNHGLAQARNNGIKLAQGKYILPLDADDKINRQYLQSAYNVLEKNKKVSVVYGNGIFFGDKNSRLATDDFDPKKMLSRNLLFCSAVFYKKDWQKVKGYNKNMKYGFEDWDLWLSFMEQGKKFYKLDETVFLYRWRSESMLNSMTEKKKLAMRVQLFKNHQQLYLDHLEDFFANVDFDNIRQSRSYILGKKITNFAKWLKLAD